MSKTEDAARPAVTYGHFDFGLSFEQEERARRLHESSVVIDMHPQGPMSPDAWTDELLVELEEQIAASGGDRSIAWTFLFEKALRGELPLYGEMFRLAGMTATKTSCRLRDETQLLKDAHRASRILSSFDWARRARTAADIRAAKAEGRVAYWGMCAFNLLRPGELHLVDMAKEFGVLDVCDLAYNTMTFIAGGCTERYDPGLSNFGLEFVRRCNDVGVIVDTSHTGRQSTLDACNASRKPVVASHTSAEALFKCDRAKSDEELKAIADTGGVIAVYALPYYLGLRGGDAMTIELMLDHVDYIVELVGWQHAAIGTDHPIPLPRSMQHELIFPLWASIGFRTEHNMDPLWMLEGFHDPRDLVNITRGLVSRGYSDEVVRGIIGENFLRVFEVVCG